MMMMMMMMMKSTPTTDAADDGVDDVARSIATTRLRGANASRTSVTTERERRSDSIYLRPSDFGEYLSSRCRHARASRGGARLYLSVFALVVVAAGVRGDARAGSKRRILRSAQTSSFFGARLGTLHAEREARGDDAVVKGSDGNEESSTDDAEAVKARGEAAARARWIGGEDHASAAARPRRAKSSSSLTSSARRRKRWDRRQPRDCATTGAIRVCVDERETPRYVPVDVLTKEGGNSTSAFDARSG